MPYTIQDIAQIVSAEKRAWTHQSISQLLIDSRRIVFPETSLFFALDSSRMDGHLFIHELIARGVTSFVVKKAYAFEAQAGINFLVVENVLVALQQLAAYHRNQFPFLPVIGITGSNGKTVVKEWLNQLLQNQYRIVRSPRSYNSQIGVPLSVWEINEKHSLGIFEAGISTTNEMDQLERIIQPTIGVLTYIGEAHADGFKNRTEKLQEKLKLFSHVHQLILGIDCLNSEEEALVKLKHPSFFCWSRYKEASLQIIQENTTNHNTELKGMYKGEELSLILPFTDQISINNAITCWCCMLVMDCPLDKIKESMLLLEPVQMRMQLKNGINHCFLINDSYSNDLSSLSLALTYLKQQAGNQKTTLILSDILEAGKTQEAVYRQVALELQQRNIQKLIGIGKQLETHAALFDGYVADVVFYSSTSQFLLQANQHQFNNEYILLKGARVYEFEQISKWLEKQQHQTLMEINLSAMVQNLKSYQTALKPSTKVMAMVKAFSYGSGSVEIARLLELHQVNYLAVAYADEGVALRKSGIRLPIMVMSADEASFDVLLNYHLEPEIFSFPIYEAFHTYLNKQGVKSFPIHVKLNTGMNRLGFEIADAPTMGGLLQERDTMLLKSVFSHLASSETLEQDAFTLHQSALFQEGCSAIENKLSYTFIKHLSNTAAIFRYPDLQYDMVRLGIGLYGIDTANEKSLQLQPVSSLKSTIAQIRKLPKGATVGYNRKGVLNRDSIIATVRIGYADGFERRLGNGKASMWIKGELAPVVGNVCMDMTMIDITTIPGVNETDTVEIFGANLPVQQVAVWADTIPYEILTGISQRVQRVYLEE